MLFILLLTLVIKYLFNTINKSIYNLNDFYKNGEVKSISIQQRQLNINSKYGESIILNKVKDLHIKEIISECNNHKDKILQLEMQINKNKLANSNLVKDINDILKEIES